MVPMADLHLHLDGSGADYPAWVAQPGLDDDFDDAALERAISEGRHRAYEALRDLDAA